MVARPAGSAPVRDVRQPVLTIVPAREIPALSGPAHTVRRMLGPHAVATGMPSVPTGKAVPGSHSAAGQVPTGGAPVTGQVAAMRARIT